MRKVIALRHKLTSRKSLLWDYHLRPAIICPHKPNRFGIRRYYLILYLYPIAFAIQSEIKFHASWCQANCALEELSHCPPCPSTHHPQVHILQPTRNAVYYAAYLLAYDSRTYVCTNTRWFIYDAAGWGL